MNNFLLLVFCSHYKKIADCWSFWCSADGESFSAPQCRSVQKQDKQRELKLTCWQRNSPRRHRPWSNSPHRDSILLHNCVMLLTVIIIIIIPWNANKGYSLLHLHPNEQDKDDTNLQSFVSFHGLASEPGWCSLVSKVTVGTDRIRSI